jgi:hypothetical protein
MATENLDAISASMSAGLNPAADAIPSPFASPLLITGIAITAAGILAGGAAASVMAIDTVR